MKRRAAYGLLWGLLLASLLGVGGCIQPFPARLARTAPAAFSEREARSFFLKSPFCVQKSGPFFARDTSLELSACWVSTYFRERRRELLKLHSPRWAKGRSAVALAAPSASDPAAQTPLWLLAPFSTNFALWPSSSQGVLAATHRVGLARAPGAEAELDLNEDWGQGDALQIDVALRLRRPGSQATGSGDACVAAIFGQIAARGISLLREDGAERVARRVAILGLGQGENGDFGPLFVRVWFARLEANGEPWLGSSPHAARLGIALPKGAAGNCLGLPTGTPGVYTERIDFDLAGIRRLAHAY